MSKPYDYLVFIGRFQPFHNGHLDVVHRGLEAAQSLIILCGSARQPASIRNPWSSVEVEAMIHASLEPDVRDRVQVVALQDVLYNEKRWVRSVQAAVKAIVDAKATAARAAPRIGLIGIQEDGKGYYPSRFPQWGSVSVEDLNGLRSSEIREALFGLASETGPSGSAYLESSGANTALPSAVRAQLSAFCESDRFATLVEEAAFIAKYRSAWRNAPYAPTFVTVDAVVIQSGHLLLVERRAQPGKGLLALPGGFVRGAETLEDASVRELREETRLKLPVPVLRGSIRARRVFDAPFRSQRGRTITQVFLFELTPTDQLPKVKGGDDARRAFWVPLAEVRPETLFEDHYHIIEAMIG